MSRLFDSGRWLLVAALACLAVWFLITWETRIAYLDLAAHSHLWTAFAAATMAGLSAVIAFRYRQSVLLPLLFVAFIVMAGVLYGQFSPGGIGEYPADLRGEVNFKALLVHTAMLGSVLLAWQGALSQSVAATPMLLVLGRALIGCYFVINALWQWYYFDIRVEHVEATGGNPALIPVAIGLQLLCGALLASGRWTRVVVWPLAIVIVSSTVMVHGDLSADAPYPVNIQVQQWFVKSTILAGLLMSLRPRAETQFSASAEHVSG
ncbi:MAG: putative membrane protein YphA (DoxX/SURF4 family) [Limisphaerales bacterium]|jgi:uncharacterized membrane protein YphA (DoxX/SURF4 family)